MSKPRFLVENFFSRRQYPAHQLSASEEPAGKEPFHVATGRRGLDDLWAPATLNTNHWIRVDCGRTRAVNMVIIDRGHNLTGKTVRAQVSDDGFTTSRDFLDATIPSIPLPVPLTNANGVRTEEGAWLALTPTLAIGKQFRLFIPAVASFAPEIVGLWIGFAPELPLASYPLDDESRELVTTEFESAQGWIGRTRPVSRAAGTLMLKLESLLQYEELRVHVLHYNLGRPAWLIHDSDQAERALLVQRPPGVQGFGFRPGWGYRQAELAWREHEPRVL